MEDSEIWKELTVVTEGEPLDVGGLNPWEHRWTSLGRLTITMPNRFFPKQQYERYVYEITHQGRTVRFSAEEVSANVWRFLVPVAGTGA